MSNQYAKQRANKTDAGNDSKAICRVSNVLRSPSPDPGRSPEKHTMRDALILAPVSIAVLALISALDSVIMGASVDLVNRYLPLYFAAWFIAWLVGSLLLRLPFIPRDISHFTRGLLVIVLFWPIHGLASAIAEEWTISHRRATWTGPSDMGYTYMYGEMSGMGYARGWADWDRKVRSHSLGGVFAGIVWLPALLLSCYTWKKILGDPPTRRPQCIIQ